jgi:hypothetical protein
MKCIEKIGIPIFNKQVILFKKINKKTIKKKKRISKTYLTIMIKKKMEN